jgi:hypothetical protein
MNTIAVKRSGRISHSIIRKKLLQSHLSVPICIKTGIGMRKDSGTVSGGARQVPKDQAMLPHIKSWHPSRMKTGIRNRLIGKKVYTLVRERA